MGAQRRQRGKPQHTGPHLRFSGRAGRRSAWFSLLPFCQTASAFRLICLFHTFCRRGGYRAMVFAPLRCPNLFPFPFALFVGCSFQLFCSSLKLFYGQIICHCCFHCTDFVSVWQGFSENMIEWKTTQQRRTRTT